MGKSIIVSEIWTDSAIKWSIEMANIYCGKYKDTEYGKTFIRSFNSQFSFRELCRMSVNAYRKLGIELTGDFSEYANKYEHSKLLNDVLKIIWAIKK